MRPEEVELNLIEKFKVAVLTLQYVVPWRWLIAPAITITLSVHLTDIIGSLFAILIVGIGGAIVANVILAGLYQLGKLLVEEYLMPAYGKHKLEMQKKVLSNSDSHLLK